MKKLKIYILALLVPILLMGCIEKGKPNVNIDTGMITIDSALSDSIQTNVSVLKYNYQFESSLVNRELLNPNLDSSIIGLLYKISEGFRTGNETSANISKYNVDIQGKKSTLFSSNALLDKSNMTGTEVNIGKQLGILNNTVGSNADHIYHLDIIKSELLKQQSDINSRLKINPYYIELQESLRLKSWLNTMKITDGSLTYQKLLENYNVISNSSLENKYSRLVSLIERDINTLKEVNVIKDLNLLLGNVNFEITNYHTKDIMTTEQRDALIVSLTKLRDLYKNYQTSANEIYNAEVAFFLSERNYLSTFTSTYYYKVRMGTTKLTLEALNNDDILAKLKVIYDAGYPKLTNSTDKELFKILYRNLNNIIARIKDYDATNPIEFYSACTSAGQLIQMLKDNKTFIDYVVQLHK